MEKIDKNTDKCCNEKNKRILKIIFCPCYCFCYKTFKCIYDERFGFEPYYESIFLLKIFFFVLSQSLIYLLSFISKKIYVLHFWFSE